jgi:hypothetical protein
MYEFSTVVWLQTRLKHIVRKRLRYPAKDACSARGKVTGIRPVDTTDTERDLMGWEVHSSVGLGNHNHQYTYQIMNFRNKFSVSLICAQVVEQLATITRY